MLGLVAWLAAVAALLTTAAAPAATLNASVDDRGGEPVAEVVVYAVPAERRAVAADASSAGPGVMDQRHEQFTPHILVTQVGGEVAFPNSDTVSHHVYSFSEPKRFELPLYQGSPHPPIKFDKAGVVDVGCNIHDHMEAHIVVVDTPFFAITGEDGSAALTGLTAGEYLVHVYTPRLRRADLPEPRPVTIAGGAAAVIEIQLDGRLRPPHVSESKSLNWTHY